MKPRICLVGQVVVDVLRLKAGAVVRLGGIFHAANALSALGCDFDIAYIAPAYLEQEIRSRAKQLGATEVIKIADLEGCPSVLLVGQPTEAGPQDYEFLLDRQQRCNMDLSGFESYICKSSPTDIIIFPGGFVLRGILLALKRQISRVHIDANFEPNDFEILATLGRPLQTLILSTSSDTFLKKFKGDCGRIQRMGLKVAQSFLLKENRGGSRYFQRNSKTPILVPAFPRRILHSVGVGDCFNSVFVCLSHRMPPASSLIYSSLIASEYASVLDQSLFRRAVDRTLSIMPHEASKLQGVSLPWERRPKIQIYIAAPDFKSADRSEIDRVVSCLKYHNFTARRPVAEYGEITATAGVKQRGVTALSDIRLLN